MVKKNILSILVALIIMYLSLTSSDTFNKVKFVNIPFLDKIIHFGMYFVLMSVILFENRKKLKSPGKLFLISLIPFFYGVLMEILQFSLTISRSGSLYDVIFNSTGILLSMLLWLWMKPYKKLSVR